MPLRSLAVVLALQLMFAMSALAISPAEIAQIVSQDSQNQRFTDTIRVRDDLTVPILKGSSVMPTIAVVDSLVFDEYIPSDPLPPIGDTKALLRCLKLGIGPFQKLSPSDNEAFSSDVRLVIWPSGHVLWTVDNPGDTALRNRKGQMVAYNFGRIDMVSLAQKLKQHLPEIATVEQDYRAYVVFRHFTFRTAAPFRELTIIKDAPTFRWQSQVWEDEESDPYGGLESSNNDPARDVAQFLGLCKAIQEVLPTQGYDRLSEEPVYECVGEERSFPQFDTPEKKKMPLEARDDAGDTSDQAGWLQPLRPTRHRRQQRFHLRRH